MSMVHDNTGFTSLGTGTSKTQLGGASLALPTWARMILAVKPQVVIDVQTAAESVVVKYELESNDFQIQPYEVLAQVIGALLGATSGGLVHKAPTYPINCPIKGGDNLNVYGTPLVSNVGAPTAGAGIVLADFSQGVQKKAKMGTLTSTGTTASTDVAGTAYTFTGGNRLVELFGAVVHTTVAAASAIIAYLKYTSSEFRPSFQLKLPLEPVGSGLSTLIQTMPQIAREPVDIEIAPNSTRIQDYLYMGLAPTVVGNFISGVMFE